MILLHLLKQSQYLFITLALMGLYACGSGGGESEEAGTEDTTQAEEVEKNLQQVLTKVPEPSEMPYQLKATGAEFSSKIPNSPDKAEMYKTTNNKAALNLGVYATDVGYVSVYEKVQNAIDYIQAVEELGDKLGISSALDPKLQERFKNNLSAIDSLTTIVDEALQQSDQYLKDNERNSIAALIFTGSFLEGLYISTQL
ncbi:MAG: hypothetical protein HC880_21140 [Bacteroidia bacterium]|nr:hypothetical protein [Bacteroidia bacterium]